MTRKTYIVETTRSMAALYLAWEFGIARAVTTLAQYPRKGFVRLPSFGPLRLRREAESMAARVRMVVAWQQGRLGRDLTAGDVYVCEQGHGWSPT